MLKTISNVIFALKLYAGIILSKVRFVSKNGTKMKRGLSVRQLFDRKQRTRYLMHSLLKEGDQYRLGTATVTLAKFGVEGKAEVAKKIAAATARREERKRILTERGEEMMLMSPEELLEFQIKNWTEERAQYKSERKKVSEKISALGFGSRKITKEESRRERTPPEAPRA